MTPTMQTFVPAHIKSVLDRLNELNDDAAKDAAAIIMAFVEQASPDAMIAVCLASNTAYRGGVVVDVSPNQAVVLHTLVEKYPEVVSVGDMHRALWGPAADKSINTVRVMMVELRKRLKPLKVRIENTPWVGYRVVLDPITL